MHMYLFKNKTITCFDCFVNNGDWWYTGNKR